MILTFSEYKEARRYSKKKKQLITLELSTYLATLALSLLWFGWQHTIIIALALFAAGLRGVNREIEK